MWAKKSVTGATGIKPAIILSTGGGVPNDVFQDILGLPTLWLPHSYTGCQHHAPGEHVLMPVMSSAMAVMAGVSYSSSS